MDGDAILAVSNFSYALSFRLRFDTNPDLAGHTYRSVRESRDCSRATPEAFDRL